MSETKTDPYPCRDEVFYGRGVWPMGEDGDMGVMIEGHGRRAVAALNASQRGLAGQFWRSSALDKVEPQERWVVIVETCGCTPERHAAEHTDELGDTGCDCDFWGLPPCTQDVYSWGCKWVDEGAPGALAVTEVAW